MAAPVEASSSNLCAIDPAYEFSAPRFFNFMVAETDEDVRKAELWFEENHHYAPSTSTLRIKATRAVQPQILCNFEGNEHISENNKADDIMDACSDSSTQNGILAVVETSAARPLEVAQVPGVCRPPQPGQTNDKKQGIAKKNSKKLMQNLESKRTKPTSVRRYTGKKMVGTLNFDHENHSIKKQKLEGGKSRQIRTVNKTSYLPHKTRNGIISDSSNFSLTNTNSKTSKEERKIYLREPSAPFISNAEMMIKFQSGIRGLPPPRNCSLSQGKPKLTLTRPKTPEFETSQRVRSVKIKSSSELEEEMMAKVPKFKARPLNKKIFEATLPPLPRSTPHPPEFKEFHLEATSRANQNSETSTIDPAESTEVKLSICSETQLEGKPLQGNTIPNPFHLHTEERGAENNEKRTVEELTQKLLEKERARVPKAHPCPYTTVYPVVPPKPKPCTKPEPFQLESLFRHEEEIRRQMEERRRRDMEEMQMRRFRAQPILQEDPITIPENMRKPLTEVQEFNLHVNHRATERAEFDKKIKEKETVYQRYKEEAESARMMEEERAVKELRRTLVPHARPVPNFDRPPLPQKSSKQVTEAKYPKLQ